MTDILRIFLKIFVREFYIINAGYFLFFFILFFGVVSPGNLVTYHRALIMGMFDSSVFLAGVMLFWFLYNVKCIFFFIKLINRPGNIFLVNLQALPVRKQLTVFVITQLLLFLPVLIYSCFVIGMAFEQDHSITGLILIIFQLFNIILPAWVGYSRGQSVFDRFKTPAIFTGISFSFYLISYTAYYRKISYFTVKVFSLFLLFIIFTLNQNDFDHINFAVLFSILISAHSLLPFFYIIFLEKNCSWYRNCPLPLIKIISTYFFTYCVLLIPELVFLFINATAHMPILEILALYGVAVTGLLLFTAILYTAHMNMKKYLQIIFVIFFLSIFLLNLKYYLVMIAIQALLAVVIFIKYYYQYEIKEAVSSTASSS